MSFASRIAATRLITPNRPARSFPRSPAHQRHHYRQSPGVKVAPNRPSRKSALMERPPRALEAAQRIAAEQVVLSDDWIAGARDVHHIATRLVNAPIWTFW